MNGYYYKILRDFLQGAADAGLTKIEVLSRGYLSDEVIPKLITNPIKKEVLEENFSLGNDGNYYFPTSYMDVFICLRGENEPDVANLDGCALQYFFTVLSKEAAEIRLNDSKHIDGQTLEYLEDAGETELCELILRDIRAYDTGYQNDIFTYVVDETVVTTLSIKEACREAVRRWKKAIPHFEKVAVFYNKEEIK